MLESYVVPKDLVDEFTEKDINSIRLAFATFDTDHSGSLELQEIVAVAREFDPTASESDIKDLLLEEDANADLLVSFSEYVAMISRARKGERAGKFSELAAKVDTRFSRAAGQTVFYAFLLLTFTVLASTSTVVFHFFKCTTFEEADGGPVSYMSADMSIDCGSTRYKNWSVYAGLSILMFPLGIPSFYFSLLWSHRTLLTDQDALDAEFANGFPTIGHLNFLVEAYRPSYFLFEVLECFRRLALASAIGIFDSTSAASAVLGLVLTFIFNFVFVEFKPFVAYEDSTLSVVLGYSLSMIFLAALMIKADLTGSSPSEEQFYGVFLVVVALAGPLLIAVQLISSNFIFVLRECWNRFVRRRCARNVGSPKEDDTSDDSREVESPTKSSMLAGNALESPGPSKQSLTNSAAARRSSRGQEACSRDVSGGGTSIEGGKSPFPKNPDPRTSDRRMSWPKNPDAATSASSSEHSLSTKRVNPPMSKVSSYGDDKFPGGSYQAYKPIKSSKDYRSRASSIDQLPPFPR